MMTSGVKHHTPLFVVLVLIGTTDLIFAVHSIPAIFAITNDPFVVLTANIFAILGLRALYFWLRLLVTASVIAGSIVLSLRSSSKAVPGAHGA